MSKRDKNKSQNNQLTAEVEQIQQISQRPQKVSVRLFRMLKERLREYKYQGPKMTSEEKNAVKTAFNNELKRKLWKTDKATLIEMMIAGMPSKAAQAFSMKTPETQQEDAQALHRARYDRLVAQIDKAELAFLAGDSGPARALVEKVDAFIGETSNQ